MRTSTFLITRPGANHWHPTDPSNKKSGLKRYGYNDTIALPSDAATDPKYNNLGLVLAGADDTGTTDVAAEQAELGQESANPAVKPAAGDIGKPDEKPAEKPNEVATLEALISELEESNGNSEFQKARERVIEADLFEEGTVPTKKAELLQALIDYRDGLKGE